MNFLAFIVWFDLLFLEYENYYPKDKKEIPKGDENKQSEGKGIILCLLTQ